MLEQTTDNLVQVEVAYSSEELQEKFELLGLNTAVVTQTIDLDIAKLNEIEASIHTPSVSAFCALLRDHPKKSNWPTLVGYINQLIYLWLSAIEDDVSPIVVLSIIRCLKLTGITGKLITTKLHLAFHQLVTETLHRYQQFTLDYVLNYDQDIQLPNVNKLIPDIQLTLAESNKTDIIALLSIHFRTENNKFLLPKEVSLKLNKQLSDILQEQVNNRATVYYIGDYQFDLLISKIDNHTQLELLTAKIFRAFEDIIFINKQSILLKPFIGCAFTVNGEESASGLYHNAKLALEHGVANEDFHVVYNESLEQKISNQIILESKILEAFDSHNLTLGFQPIIHIASNKCIGAELLLRSHDPESQYIHPGKAIEVLNNVGKGKMFTRWLINSAFRFSHELEAHQLDLYLTINLRAEDLYDHELPDLFANALSLWKLPPKRIVLEITENGILEANEQTSAIIQALAKMGFKFALDDFGTGFSSLIRLKTLPIDIIKVDQSFIKHIAESFDDYKIVESIAVLAKGLKKEVIAEGIEDENALALVKKLGLDKGQGYYYSKSLPYDDFVNWVKSYNS